MPDFIPRTDLDALAYMQNFASKATAHPSAYSLDAADAEIITRVTNDFASALALLGSAATRTPVNVGEKSRARTSAEQVIRLYASQIKVNAGISDANKKAIGVKLINPTRSRISVPTSSPMLSIVGALQGSHTLRYVDTNTPTRRAKPFGAASLQLFVHVGPTITRNPDEARFLGAFTTNPIGVGFKPHEDCKKATYFGRWASRTGETGPWSLPVSMSIAA